MDKKEEIKEYLLAKSLLDVYKEYDIAINTYQYINQKVVMAGQTIYEQVDYILGCGLNPLYVIEVNHKPVLLLESLLKIANHPHIIDNIIERITPEQLKEVPYKEIENLIVMLLEDDLDNSVNAIFQKGFKFIQGNDSSALEVDCALSGNIKFFEFIKQYMPDFDFERVYWDKTDHQQMTLSDMLNEEINNTSNDAYITKEKCTNVLMFINSVLKEKSYTRLHANLPENEERSNKAKI